MEDRKNLVHVVFVAGSKTKQSRRACQNFGLQNQFKPASPATGAASGSLRPDK
jgi:hypothetical protein